MTTLQIIALILIGVGIAVSVGFFIAFIVEVSKQDKNEQNAVEKQPESEINDAEVVEIDIDEMLAKLEENTTKTEEVGDEIDIDAMLAKLEENATQEEVQAESAPEEFSEPEVVAELENTEEVSEDVQEVAEEIIEPVQEEVVEDTQEEEKEEPKTTIVIKKIVKEGPEFDYRVRLDKIKESEEKLEKDLEKTLKAITKYERTERRLARNQKLLDRKAGELANLNLLMYNVTDIKNVDEEKKTRQEELVAHISELKASIEDAQKYLSANAEKHANNIKLRDYLLSEQKRYKEEWAELEILIAQAEGRDPITTVETHVEEVPASDDETPADDGDQE